MGTVAGFSLCPRQWPQSGATHLHAGRNCSSPEGDIRLPIRHPHHRPVEGRHYRINLYMGGDVGPLLGVLDKVRLPAKRLLVADGYEGVGGVKEGYIDQDGVIHNRHAGECANILLADGHVESRNYGYIHAEMRGYGEGDLGFDWNHGKYFWGKNKVWSY